MRTETISIYSFDELSPEAQNTAFENHRNDETSHYMWYAGQYEQMEEECLNFGFTDPKFYFSGFSRQGDGACFTSGIKISVAFDRYCEEHPVRHRKWLREILIDYFKMQVVSTDSHYSHEYTCSILYQSFDTGKHDRIWEVYSSFEEWLEEKRISLCLQLYRNLEQEYEERHADSYVEESIRNRELEFYEDGTDYKQRA